MLTTTSQFQHGARALRSEIVSVLKHNGLLIFNITDIAVGNFLDEDARSRSEQLETLRANNTFLYASEEELPSTSRLQRYLRSECIVRVSVFVSSQDYLTNNIFKGITSGTSWPPGIGWIEQAKEVPIKSEEIWGNGNITLSHIFHRNSGTQF